MKRKWILAAAVAAPIMHMPGSAQAFDCPAHFAEAQAAIDKAAESIKHIEGGMPLASRAHLQHAKMSLVEAKYHHAQTGDFHHAGAIVRANEARGHAVAAYFMSQGLAKR